MTEIDTVKLFSAFGDEALLEVAQTLPAELERRGLELSAGLSSLALGYQIEPPAPTEPTIDVDQSTDIAINTLSSLGLIKDRGQAREVIGQQMAELSIGDRLDGKAYEAFPAIDLHRGLSLDKLVTAFDQKQDYETYIWQALWNSYGTQALNNRYRQFSTPDKLGKLPIRAMVMVLGAENSYDEDGLHFTNQDLEEQMSSVDATDYGVITPADYIVLQAQRREAGKQALDTKTYTRFIQMPNKTVDGGSCVGDAYSRVYGQVVLGDSRGDADPRGGVRLSVGPANIA